MIPCKYEDTIEMLKNCVKNLESDLKVLSVELKEVRSDITEIKNTVNSISNIRLNVEYMKGKKESEEIWFKAYLGIVKDLVLISLMILLSMKLVVGVNI